MRFSSLILLVAVAGCGRPPAPDEDLPEDLEALTEADPGYAESRWVGPRTDGAACAADRQCRSGVCSATEAACGVCLEHRLLGQSCGAANQACSRSAVCDQGTCRSTRKVFGEPCALYPKGGDAGECDLELICLRGAFTARDVGTCTRPLPLGATCGGTGCRQGAWCGPNGVCAPYVPPEPGPQPVLPAGASCGVNGGKFTPGVCAEGTTCGNLTYPNGGYAQGTQSTCLALPTEGQPAIFYRCAPGLFARYRDDGSPPVCEPKLGVGGDCAGYLGTNACAAGFECRFGKCATVCQ